MNVVGIKKLIKKNEYFGFFGKKTKHVINYFFRILFYFLCELGVINS